MTDLTELKRPPTPDEQAQFLQSWANDIRKLSGVSVDADRLDDIAFTILSLIKRVEASEREARSAAMGESE